MPPGLNWDLWLGPARAAALSSGLRAGRAGATGGPSAAAALRDMGIHNLDPAFYALELDAPKTVEATASRRRRRGRPRRWLVTYRFGARGDDRGP